MKRCGENLLAIINDVLDFSKIENGSLTIHRQDVELTEFIESLLDTISARLPFDSKIMLHYDVGPNVPSRIMTDPHRLCQIINNLVGNAIKFSHQGGRIFIKVFQFKSLQDLEMQLEQYSVLLPSDEVFLKYLQERESLFEPNEMRPSVNSRLLFMVSDQGIGITSENAKKLFKMFAQVFIYN